MRRRNIIPILRFLSLAFIFFAIMLSVLQLVSYSRIRSRFPKGMVIADIPVGGLDAYQAADRLTQIYSLPIELHYDDAVIQLKPSIASFDLDLESMLAAADMQRVNQPFWSAFWDFLWGRLPSSKEIPLRATYSKERLQQYLENEIAARYDRPPEANLPLDGSYNFESGTAGTSLDIDRAITLIEDAMYSPTNRSVNLTYDKVAPARPSLQNLQILLQRIIEVDEFEGVAELYLLDLQTRQELHFALQNDEVVQPNISFTAASTMKIPIMISTYRRTQEPAPQGVTEQLELMIELSENDPADALMNRIGDNLGPLLITEDMQTLGLENTFLAGYFYPGAPLLKRFETPANQRQDVNIYPDAYNQTTPVEIGMLLDDIYQCSETGGGTFAAAYPGEISQAECNQMIKYLTLNRIGVLIQAGLPEGTKIAHKHGWITELDGLIHTLSDVGIVYTPGGDYVLTIFLYDPVQLFFDPTNELVAELSSAIYNYFNLPD